MTDNERTSETGRNGMNGTKETAGLLLLGLPARLPHAARHDHVLLTTEAPAGAAVPQTARRRWVQRAVVGLVAVVTATLMSPILPASALTGNDFNPNYKTIGYVDDCTVEMGPVVDPDYAYPTYRKIGGVRVNCNSYHSTIDALVEEAVYYSGAWHYYTQYQNYGVRHNTYGTGYTLGGILRSVPFCFGTNNRGYYWSTVVRVRTENTGKWLWSTAAIDPAGC